MFCTLSTMSIDQYLHHSQMQTMNQINSERLSVEQTARTNELMRAMYMFGRMGKGEDVNPAFLSSLNAPLPSYQPTYLSTPAPHSATQLTGTCTADWLQCTQSLCTCSPPHASC